MAELRSRPANAVQSFAGGRETTDDGPPAARGGKDGEVGESDCRVLGPAVIIDSAEIAGCVLAAPRERPLEVDFHYPPTRQKR